MSTKILRGVTLSVSAPEWAEWAHFDANGQVWVSLDKPFLDLDEDDTIWMIGDTNVEESDIPPYCDNWKRSLRRLRD